MIWKENQINWRCFFDIPQHNDRKTISLNKLIPFVFINSKTKTDYTILYAHANGADIGKHIIKIIIGDIYILLKKMSDLLLCNVAAMEYPGYGISIGDTNKETINIIFLASYNFLTNLCKIPPNKIILWGVSIGTGPMSQLAMQLPSSLKPLALILQVFKIEFSVSIHFYNCGCIENNWKNSIKIDNKTILECKKEYSSL